MRLAYWTGIRRWACSMKMTPAITARPITITTEKMNQPAAPSRLSLMDHREAGNCAAIWVKIITDMPLPTPRSVISSPSHMITPVPAVMVRIMVRIGKTPLS